MTIQSKLLIKTDKTESFKPKKEPSHLLNWGEMKLTLKRYLLLQVIRAIPADSQKYLSIDDLSGNISRNSAIKRQNRSGIVKDQLKIYIENLIYYGFIDDSYSRGLVLNDKIYDELQTVDSIITRISGEVV
ncbi:hypothetical protein KTG15_09215 [Methanobacterium sp. YSL]|nr:hypothetical protein [Methanobacterium sp. YSL]